MAGSGTREPAVVLRGVGKHYAGRGRSREVLVGLSAEIPAGEFVVLVGRSGSGKSTLLNLIGGLDRPTSGDVIVSGQSLGALDEDGLSRLRRRAIGYVFQFFNLIPTLTVAENLLLPLELIGVTDSPARERSARWLAAVGLAGRGDDYLKWFRIGEHVRRMLRRFRREMFPRAARGDPLWPEIVETAARMLERTLRMMFRLPTGYGL
jgi:putative ABC transport system ATP-binding protein